MKQGLILLLTLSSSLIISLQVKAGDFIESFSPVGCASYPQDPQAKMQTDYVRNLKGIPVEALSLRAPHLASQVAGTLSFSAIVGLLRCDEISDSHPTRYQWNSVPVSPEEGLAFCRDASFASRCSLAHYTLPPRKSEGHTNIHVDLKKFLTLRDRRALDQGQEIILQARIYHFLPKTRLHLYQQNLIKLSRPYMYEPHVRIRFRMKKNLSTGFFDVNLIDY